MSRARTLANRANQNTLAVDTSTGEVGVSSASPRTTLDVRGEVQVGDSIQAGVAGVLTATTFSADSYESSTGGISADSLSIAGISTIVRLAVTNEVVTGIITALGLSGNLTGAAATLTGALSGNTGTFSGAVNIDATTDSTSTSTGALIVDGGLGVAKNVYIGAGLSVAGTLTYEDVTSVDSVGLITAKSGVNVTGGQIQVGAAFSVGPAGVVTAAAYYGDGSNLSNITSTTINNNADNRLITGSGTANTLEGESTLTYNGSTLTADCGQIKFKQNLQVNSGTDGTHQTIQFAANGETNFFYQSATRFQLISEGIRFYGNTLDINCDLDVAGIGTFTDGLTISADSKYLKIGAGSDLQLVHNGTNSYVDNSTGHLYIRSGTGVDITNADGSENYIVCTENGSVKLYYDHSNKIETTNDGVVFTGIATVSAGVAYTGLLRESFAKTDGKLSDNTNIDLEDGMVHYFTTTETTTSTPNLRWNSSFSLGNKMNTNDAITVTIITTAAAGGYSAQLSIDGSGVTEQWVGGSAPSAGGSDGYDIYTYNILKTCPSSYFVIGNVVNAT